MGIYSIKSPITTSFSKRGTERIHYGLSSCDAIESKISGTLEYDDLEFGHVPFTAFNILLTPNAPAISFWLCVRRQVSI